MKTRDQELPRRRGELIDDDRDKVPERDKDKTPDTPPSEPKPVPVEEPPPNPDKQGPYIVNDENGRAPSGGTVKTGALTPAGTRQERDRLETGAEREARLLREAKIPARPATE